jgi:ABC-type multidrug transport system ATPase subunit
MRYFTQSDVLILTEPTGLDPNQLLEIRYVIKNAGKDKTVSIYISCKRLRRFAMLYYQ